VTAASTYVESPGTNLIELLAEDSTGYLTRYPLVVHAK
jgi:hypothetical protein